MYSCQEFAYAPQEYVYGRGEDASLRAALKQGKGAAEFWVDTQPLVERWDKVKKLAEEEQRQRRGTPPPESTPKESDSFTQQLEKEKREMEETIRRGVVLALEPKSVEWFRARAYQQVRRYIRLLVEPDVAATLKTELRNSFFKDIKGIDGRKCVIILFDSACHGEAAISPMSRLPPLSELRVRKLVASVISARNTESATTPLEGDVYMLFDGGRGPVAETILLSPFSSNSDAAESTSHRSNKMDVNIKRVSLVFDEASILKRRERQRSEHVTQTSTMYVVTADGLKVPRKDYSKYPGFSNRGSAISPIVLPTLDQQLTVPAKDKKAIWGPHRGPICQSEDSTADHSNSEAIEPVCFHSLPVSFYKDLFETHFAVGVIDLTVGSATATEAALALKLPYFGICPTEFHACKVIDFLAERMLSMMSDQTSSFYDPESTPKKPLSTMTPTSVPPNVKKSEKKKKKKQETESESESSSSSPSSKKQKKVS